MEDHPDLRVKPVVVLLGMVLASAILSLLAPMPVSRKKGLRLAGIPMLAAGLGLGFSAIRQMRRAGTNVNPNLPVTALVRSGPYRFTRNPIYLGMALLLAGLGLLANSLWFLPFLGGLVLVLQTQVIHFEEDYLENKFGDEYRAFKQQVRRWL